LLLIDSKVGLKESDRKLMTLMDGAGVSYQIVLTKCDRLRENEVLAVIDRMKLELGRHPACHPEIATTSARNGQGIGKLRDELAKLTMGA